MTNEDSDRFTGIESRLGVYISDTDNKFGSLIQELMSEGDDDQHIVDLLRVSVPSSIAEGQAEAAA